MKETSKDIFLDLHNVYNVTIDFQTILDDWVEYSKGVKDVTKQVLFKYILEKGKQLKEAVHFSCLNEYGSVVFDWGVKDNKRFNDLTLTLPLTPQYMAEQQLLATIHTETNVINSKKEEFIYYGSVYRKAHVYMSKTKKVLLALIEYLDITIKNKPTFLENVFVDINLSLGQIDEYKKSCLDLIDVLTSRNNYLLRLDSALRLRAKCVDLEEGYGKIGSANDVSPIVEREL